MGNRNTAIVSSALLFVALVQLGGLLRPTVVGISWQMLVLGAALLAAVITWTGLAYRVPVWVVAVIGLVTYGMIALRVLAAELMTFGVPPLVLPTAATFAEARTELAQAMAIIRTGIEPVVPVDGVVAIVIGVFWVAAMVTVYGLLRRPGLAVIPGLVLVVQFAVMDRTPTSLPMVLLFAALLAAAILAVTSDQRRSSSGRMVYKSGWLPSTGLAGRVTATATGLALLGTVFAVGAFANRVPYDGVVPWRSGTGLTGDFFGGISYNPFIGIQQSLVSRSSAPLFYAEVEGEVAPSEVFFRLLTMETYEGGKFFASQPDIRPIVDSPSWHTGGQEFAGPTAQVTTTVLIDRLQMDWLPAAYAPASLGGDTEFAASIMVRPDDGALRFAGGLTYPELVYSVTSDIPQPDMAVLTGNADGSLSPLFAAAAAGGAAVPQPVAIELRATPPGVDRYLALPDNLDAGIAELAAQTTAGLGTSFERGLALEAWFRSDAFEYTTDINPGHAATDLAEWLLPENSDSPNFRRGYCENFATSMAVLARTLDIPSRVVLGFTPGRPTAPGGDTVVVTDRNAHAWVELWMPAQGWVRFDPTPRPDGANPSTTAQISTILGFDPTEYLDEIDDPESVIGALPPAAGVPLEVEGIGDLGAEGGGSGGAFNLPNWVVPVLAAGAALLVLVGGLPLIKRLRSRRRWARLRSGDITAAWEEIVASLTDYGHTPAPSMTPAELARSTDPAMVPLAMVYGQTVYGPPRPPSRDHRLVAERSLLTTTDQLAQRHSRWQRLRALYSPASLLASLRRRP